MTPEHPEWYLITLADLQPRAAVRRFRQSIKDEWGCCAYCGRTHDEQGNLLEMTLDHVIPGAGVEIVGPGTTWFPLVSGATTTRGQSGTG